MIAFDIAHKGKTLSLELPLPTEVLAGELRALGIEKTLNHIGQDDFRLRPLNELGEHFVQLLRPDDTLQRIATYDVTLEYADPGNYGLQHAAYYHNLDANCRLLDYVDLAGYGAEMLRADGYEATRYGAVQLGDMEQEQALADSVLEMDNQSFGGMKGMA